MKIGWDGLPRLLKELWQKDVDLPQKVANSKTMPNRLVAQVKESLDRHNVLLRWEGSDIRSRVDTPVQKGEYLLLQFKEWSGKKQLFKVLARSFDPLALEGERTTLTTHLLLSGVKEDPLPLIVRIGKNVSDPEDEKEGKKHNPGNKDGSGAEITLEFVAETEILGVVVVRIGKKQDQYTGKLLVETRRTGKYLEEGFSELQSIINPLLNEAGISLQLLRWEIVPAWDLKDIKTELRQISFILDQKA